MLSLKLCINQNKSLFQAVQMGGTICNPVLASQDSHIEPKQASNPMLVFNLNTFQE